MTKDEIRNSLINSEYAGVLKGKGYETYCLLSFDEINNFVQNAGMYDDLEIINIENQEVLFDTYGTFINRIYPELSSSDRENCRNYINKTASVLQEYIMPDEVMKPMQNVIDYLEEMNVDLKYHSLNEMKCMTM
ncbi:hypothetical protein [uncultured Thomasclavelia sp.]|uniref:hypothetical protein n=1 Tax=uncultured Thomasclavelia sp. TaxID=3025759 RepID=UPI002598815F|nr:hypothetical protein [uncultured Thomasclavelia sp.]